MLMEWLRWPASLAAAQPAPPSTSSAAHRIRRRRIGRAQVAEQHRRAGWLAVGERGSGYRLHQ